MAISQFNDARISYHRNDQNIGRKDLVDAWTKALSYADAEWCILASDDDVYAPTFLSEMMRLHEKYPACDLLHGRMDIIDYTSRVIHIAEPRDEYESAIQFIYNRACLRKEQCAPDFMFRRSAFLKCGGFVPFPLAWYSDDATWFKLAGNGVACSQDILFHFRNSGSNISSSFSNVKTKVAAGQMFITWLDEFSRALTPTNDEEQKMLTTMMRDAKAGVMRDACYDLGHTTPGSCLKMIFNAKVPITTKLKMLRLALPYFLLPKDKQ